MYKGLTVNNCLSMLGPVYLGATAVCSALGIGIFIYLAPLEPGFLCLQFTFSELSFTQVISEWDSNEIVRYRTHFIADFMFLFLYGLLGFEFGRRCSKPLQAGPWLTVFLTASLPMAAVCDVCENAFHWVLAADIPPSTSILYLLSGIAVILKFLGIGVFFSSVILAFRKRHKKSSVVIGIQR